MPIGMLRLQIRKSLCHTVTAGTTNRIFTNQNRQTKYHQADQIQQNKCRTAILTTNIRKFPYIAQTDCTAGGYQDKSQPCTETFPFFHSISSFYQSTCRFLSFPPLLSFSIPYFSPHENFSTQSKIKNIFQQSLPPLPLPDSSIVDLIPV